MQPTGGKRPPSINTSVLTVHFYTNVVGTLYRAGEAPAPYGFTELVVTHLG